MKRVILSLIKHSKLKKSSNLDQGCRIIFFHCQQLYFYNILIINNNLLTRGREFDIIGNNDS